MRLFWVLLFWLIALPATAQTTAALADELAAKNVDLRDWDGGGLRLKSLRGETIGQNNLNWIASLVASADGIKSIWSNQTTFTDLFPLIGLELEHFWLSGGGRLTDVSPLKDMPLTSVSIDFSPIASLEPLRGKSLTVLRANGFTGESLELIMGMNLKVLGLMWTDSITDLSPIKGMALRT